jgi:hypothetical protein
MWVGWNFWLTQNNMAFSLEMPETFKILKASSANARLFLTHPKDEYRFLQFSETLNAMMQNLIMYNIVTSMCGKPIVLMICLKRQFSSDFSIL